MNWNVINPVRSQRSSIYRPMVEISEGTVAQIDRNSLVLKVRTFRLKYTGYSNKTGTPYKLYSSRDVINSTPRLCRTSSNSNLYLAVFV